MKIPLVIASELWHVGDLDKNTQGQRQSFEGNLFSASACPNAWMGIARLGGGKYYAQKGEVMLIDMLSALSDPSCEHLRLAVEQWAVKRRLIEQGITYVVAYHDCEADEEDALREMHFETEAEALLEAGEYEADVEPRAMLLATEALLKIHNLTGGHASGGMEYALIEWVREHLVGASMIKGVYWDEKLDELGLSAPRAGMFSTQGFAQQEHLPDDEDCLAAVDFVTMERYAVLNPKKGHEDTGMSL